MLSSIMRMFVNPRAVVRWIVGTVGVFVVLLGFLWWLSTGATLPDDGDPVHVTTDAALAFAQRSVDALSSATENRSITLAATQEELTSVLAVGSTLSTVMGAPGAEQTAGLEQLAQQFGGQVQGGELLSEWQSLSDARQRTGASRWLPEDFRLRVAVSEPEVRLLADGRVIVRGTGEWGFFSVPARVVVKPRVAGGEIEFDFVEGQFGRLGLSETLFDLVGAGLERLLLASTDYAEITALEVSEGRLIVSGRVNR